MIIMALCVLSATAVGVRAWLDHPLSPTDLHLAAIDATLPRA